VFPVSEWASGFLFVVLVLRPGCLSTLGSRTFPWSVPRLIG
jgi:hypothetical protein